MNVVDLQNVSDDDLMSMAPPVVDPTGDAERQKEAEEAARLAQEKEDKEEAEAQAAEEARLAQEEADRLAAEEAAKAGNTAAEGGNVVAENGNVAGEGAATAAQNGQEVKPDPTANSGTQAPGSEPAAKTEGGKQPEAGAPDLAGFYAAVTSEFNANGKKLKFTDPKEVVQLMQMGANYTQKMQALAPQRKILQMLEQAGVANEQDLSFFIDLKKGNQGAIAKLLKDSKFDVSGYDEDSDPAYRAGNHTVSDESVNFNDELQDILGSHGGAQTVQIFNSWDQASKDELWKDPSIMRSIHDQRQSGVYDVITAEVEKRRMLGSIPKSVGFLQAYNVVGQELVQAEREAAAAKAAKAAEVKAPVTTTVATPKPVVANSAAAAAAGNTRSSGKKADQLPNFMTMTDKEIEEFDISKLKV